MQLKSILACSAAMVAMTASAMAQTKADNVESVVVTGSRVISDIANSPTPVTIVSTEELQANTPSNIPDGLNKLPVFGGSAQPRDAGNGGTAAGLNILALRNFGAQRTLVLLDGHRVPPSTANGTVDVDTLPQMLMSRVDVVTGGASAVYGSDAVTGVVNFILDKKFDGLKFDINSGISNYGDGFSYKTGVAYGTDLFGGRGHFEGSLQHFSQDGIRNFARPYGPQVFVLTGNGTAATPFATTINTRRGDSTFGGLVQGCSPACGAGVSGQQFISNGVLGPFTPGALSGTANQQSGGDGAYNIYGSAQTAFRTNEAFGRFSYDIDDTTNFWVQGVAAEGFANGWWFPAKLTPGNGQASTFYKNNPFLPAAVQAALGNNGTNPVQNSATNTPPTNTFQLGTYIASTGPAGLVGTRDVNRNLSISTGLDGTLFGKYSWDLFYTHGENRAAVTNINNSNYQKQFAALDAVTNSAGQTVCYATTPAAGAAANAAYAGCVPLNPFGPTAITQNAFGYFTAPTWFHMTNVVDNLGGSLSGTAFDNWAGPVKFALSAEARFNDYLVDSNASPTAKVDCTGLRICSSSLALWAQNVIAPAHASNNVWEFAGEINAPLLKDVPLVQSLDLNLAGRYTDYSTSGAVQTWKIGIDHHVNDTIRFRATTSIDIRAPTLNDLFSPAQSSVTGFVDQHTSVSNTVFLSTQGNAALVPEVARTYTGGIVLTPDFIPGLTTSLDFYSIKLKNAIGSISATNNSIQTLCEQSGGNSPYCSLFQRPLPFSDHTPANFPSAIFSQNLNTALSEIEGWDFEADYGWAMSDIVSDWGGNWTLRVLGNYQPVNDSQSFANAAYSYGAVPSGHVTTSLRYDINDWAFGLQDRWVSGFGKSTAAKGTTGSFYTSPHARSFNSIDLNVAKNFDLGGGSYTSYFTVQNLINARPDVYPQAGSIGIFYPVPSGQDVMGRYFTIGLRANL
jgi:iron complex outermembrane receptor protein